MVVEIKSMLENSYSLQMKASASSSVNPFPVQGRQDAILKQVFPQYLYSPPFGYPKRLNGIFLRRLAENINVSSVLKTIKDGIILTDWEIAVEDGIELTEEEEAEKKEIEELFKNPNPEDTWEDFLEKFLEDLFVLEAGCITNIFSRQKGFDGHNKLVQLRVVDGNSILKNPDIHGSFQNRESVIKDFNQTYQGLTQTPDWRIAQTRYGNAYSSKAAYFQYNGALAYSIPIPYGKDELIYMQQNPSSYSVYTNGSPVSDSIDVILALVYGVKYHLDFYLNGNTPEGLIQMAGGTDEDVKSLKSQLENATYTFDNSTGYERKMGYVLPIVTSDNTNFVPLTFNSKDMEIIATNRLLNKLLWQRFGVTADEMGETEDSSKNVSKTQVDTSLRKALAPPLKRLASNFNKNIIQKFFKTGFDKKVYFKWMPKNPEEENLKLDMYQKRINLKLDTWQTLAAKEGLDIVELEKHHTTNEEAEISKQTQISQASGNNFGNNTQIKSLAQDVQVLETPLEKVMKDYITEIDKRTKELSK